MLAQIFSRTSKSISGDSLPQVKLPDVLSSLAALCRIADAQGRTLVHALARRGAVAKLGCLLGRPV